MDHAALYAERLKTPDQAAALIRSGAKVAMGLGVSQPPALLKALAERAERGEVEDVNLYYLLSTAIAGDTVQTRVSTFTSSHSRRGDCWKPVGMNWTGLGRPSS